MFRSKYDPFKGYLQVPLTDRAKEFRLLLPGMVYDNVMLCL